MCDWPHAGKRNGGKKFLKKMLKKFSHAPFYYLSGADTYGAVHPLIGTEGKRLWHTPCVDAVYGPNRIDNLIPAG